MFRVSQHPSSGVLNTVTAASGTGYTTCTATPVQRGLIGTGLCKSRATRTNQSPVPSPQSPVPSISCAEFYLNLMKTLNDSAVLVMKFVNGQQHYPMLMLLMLHFTRISPEIWKVRV